MEKQREYTKQYKQDNKQRIQEYRENHRDEINGKQKEKHNCECGGKFTRVNRSEHLRTHKHKGWELKQMNNIFQLLQENSQKLRN